MVSKRGVLAQDKEVGKRIKVRRLHLQMSQTSLGDAIGLTFQQIQKYENGTNRVGAGRLQLIAKSLKVAPSYFFDEVENGSVAGNGFFELLGTAHSLRLVKAFAKIDDPRIRESIVELIESIAKSP